MKGKTIVTIIFLVAFTTLVIGPPTGISILIPSLQKTGVFSDLCHKSPCDEQMTAISKTISQGLTAFNAVAFFAGIILDMTSYRYVGFFAIILWSVFNAITVTKPNDGIIFSIAYIGSTLISIILFLVLMVDYVSTLPSRYQIIARSLITGAWDLGTGIYPIMATIYNNTNIQLYQMFYAYSILVLICSLVPLCMLFPLPLPCHTHVVIAQDISNDLDENKQNKCMKLFHDLYAVIRTMSFWILVAIATVSTVWHYTWFPIIIQHMEWHGMSRHNAETANGVFAWMLTFIGFSGSMIVGLGIRKWSKTVLYTILLIMSVLALFSGIIASLKNISKITQYLQYLGFALIIVHRTMSWSLISAVFFQLFPSKVGVQTGKSLGLIYTISGIIGTIVNPLVIEYLSKHPDGFYVLHSICAIMSIIFCIIFGLVLLYKCNEECNDVSFIRQV